MPNPQRPASNSFIYFFMAFFALPFAGAGVYIALAMGNTLFTCHIAQSWSEVPAHILRTHVIHTKSGSGYHGLQSTSYEVTVEYAYEYNGRKYTGHDIGLYGNKSLLGDVYRELSEYQKTGKPFHCYVNPVCPEQAFLYRDFLTREDLMCGMVVVLAIVGSLGILLAAVIDFRKKYSRTTYDPIGSD